MSSPIQTPLQVFHLPTWASRRRKPFDGGKACVILRFSSSPKPSLRRIQHRYVTVFSLPTYRPRCRSISVGRLHRKLHELIDPLPTILSDCWFRHTNCYLVSYFLGWAPDPYLNRHKKWAKHGCRRIHQTCVQAQVYGFGALFSTTTDVFGQ